jgi:hypothetical protein
MDDDAEPLDGTWLKGVGFDVEDFAVGEDYVIGLTWDEQTGLDLRIWSRDGSGDGSWGAGLIAFGGPARMELYLPKTLNNRGDVRELARALGAQLTDGTEKRNP